MTTSFDPATCTCDNLLLEAHYTVFFEDLDASSFKLTNITIDVIYGTYTPKDCSEQVRMARKTSWAFKRNATSRKTSGGPGYIKGKPILTGDIQGTEKDQSIQMRRGPFKIRGADDRGECYMVKTPIVSGT